MLNIANIKIWYIVQYEALEWQLRILFYLIFKSKHPSLYLRCTKMIPHQSSHINLIAPLTSSNPWSSSTNLAHSSIVRHPSLENVVVNFRRLNTILSKRSSFVVLNLYEMEPTLNGAIQKIDENFIGARRWSPDVAIMLDTLGHQHDEHYDPRLRWSNDYGYSGLETIIPVAVWHKYWPNLGACCE